MKATISKEFGFAAAHTIPHHEGGAGKCARPHGHNYKVEVEVYGDVQESGDEAGMVIDFGRVKALADGLDHRDLNAVLPDVVATTAECLAHWFVDRILDTRAHAFEGVRVTVWETPTSSATARWIEP